MKKLAVSCFYLIVTLAVTAGSFFLPGTLLSYQDQQMFSKVEKSNFKSMEFTYSFSLLDTIQLLSGEYYTVEYPSAASSRTKEEIKKITLDLIKQLRKRGISILSEDDEVIEQTASLQLAICTNPVQTNASYAGLDTAADSAAKEEDGKDTFNQSKTAASDDPDASSDDITTAVIWNSMLYTEYGYWARLAIDDKSGKLAGISFYSGLLDMIYYGGEKTGTLIDALCAFAQDYYELPAEIVVQRSEETASFDGVSSKTPDVSYKIQLTAESGEVIQMPLKIYPDVLSLNSST